MLDVIVFIPAHCPFTFLTMVKKRKLRWFGYVSRSSGLAKTILHTTVNGKKEEGVNKEEV